MRDHCLKCLPGGRGAADIWPGACTRKGLQAAKKYETTFGKGKLFPGASGSWHSGAENGESAAASDEQGAGIDLVATNDVHYTYAEDAAAHDILLCLQTGKKLQDEDRMRYEGGQYYVKSPEEMEALFLMRRRLWKTPGKLPSAAMWRSSSA